MWHLSSLTRDQTRVPYIGRQILNHWTTREVLIIPPFWALVLQIWASQVVLVVKNPKYKVGVTVVRIAFRIAVELHETVRAEHRRIDGGRAPALLVFTEHKAIQSPRAWLPSLRPVQGTTRKSRRQDFLRADRMKYMGLWFYFNTSSGQRRNVPGPPCPQPSGVSWIASWFYYIHHKELKASKNTVLDRCQACLGIRNILFH